MIANQSSMTSPTQAKHSSKLFVLFRSFRFLFSFRNRRADHTEKAAKNKRETLNNVLRRFANTTRKLLRKKKIKASSPPTKENEVLFEPLNAFVVAFSLSLSLSRPRVCIMQLFI
jgi:hypothetical protein